MNRSALKDAYRRLATGQRVSPEELSASLDRVMAVCRRATHHAWLSSAAHDRREAIASPNWARKSYIHAARNCLDYARATR
jgi:hypothetical protein